MTKQIKTLVEGPVGEIEVLCDCPDESPKGLVLVAHPHPLYGGTLHNKVTYTLAKAFLELGYQVIRPNFRGVGGSFGKHDYGFGETYDLLSVLSWGRDRYSLDTQSTVLVGFSFGALVQARVAQHLPEIFRLFLIAPTMSYGSVIPLKSKTLVFHGEVDEKVPLAEVFCWAKLHSLPVLVFPGADHFFRGQLPVLKELIIMSLSRF